jgi:hypothetical protein
MDEAKLKEFTENFVDAWNSQDVDRVAGCYSDDLFYVDPNTKGAITDQDNMRRYLKKLLAAWDMHWSLREAYLFGGKKTVEIDGMDLILIKGEKIKRNEVYFDRTALAPLM